MALRRICLVTSENFEELKINVAPTQITDLNGYYYYYKI
jgi:hypothetical protein